MLSQIRWLQRVQLGVLLLDPVLTRLRRGDVMEARALDLLREHGSRVNYSAILLFLCQRGVVQLMVLGCTSSLAEARVKQWFHRSLLGVSGTAFLRVLIDVLSSFSRVSLVCHWVGYLLDSECLLLIANFCSLDVILFFTASLATGWDLYRGVVRISAPNWVNAFALLGLVIWPSLLAISSDVPLDYFLLFNFCELLLGRLGWLIRERCTPWPRFLAREYLAIEVHFVLLLVELSLAQLVPGRSSLRRLGELLRSYLRYIWWRTEVS